MAGTRGRDQSDAGALTIVLVAAIALALTLSGCSSLGRILPARTEPATPPAVAAPEQPAPVPSEDLKLAERVGRLEGEMLELQNALARLVARSRLQEEELQYLQRRVTELRSDNQRAEGVGRGGLVSPPAEPGPLPPNAVTVTPAQELFQAAMTHYRGGELDAALLFFSELVATHPDHPFREGAQFLVAEILIAQDDCQGAAKELRELLATFPKGSRTPDALLKLGLCQRRLGDEAAARQSWTRVLKEHPKSDAVPQASELLRSAHRP